MIEIEGVSLREILPVDKDILFEMINDEFIKEYIVGESNPVSYEQHSNWFDNLKNEKKRERYMILFNSNTVGTISLDDIDCINNQVSLSIKLMYDRGKGIGHKAVRIILDYIFNQKKMRKVYAEILDYNIASQKTFEKNGFKLERIDKNAIEKEGKKTDLRIYSIFKEDYDENNGNR